MTSSPGNLDRSHKAMNCRIMQTYVALILLLAYDVVFMKSFSSSVDNEAQSIRVSSAFTSFSKGPAYSYGPASLISSLSEEERRLIASSPTTVGGVSFAELWRPPRKPPLVTVRGCVIYETTCWDELRACMETRLLGKPENISSWISLLNDGDIKDMPFQNSNYSAVIVEFRPSKSQLRWSIDNMMDNLPVHWLMQIVGGPTVLACVEELYPLEVSIGKILLRRYDVDESKPIDVNKVFLSQGLYDQIYADNWLFFQVCRRRTPLSCLVRVSELMNCQG